MQPFEKASEESRRRNESPFTYAKQAITAVGGGFALNKALPLLNKFIPENLATKGLKKIDPRFGGFIKKAMSSGFDFDEIREFITEKVDKKNPKEDRNIIQQYSPELFQFIDQEVKKGRSAIEAGAIAQNDKRFSQVINKLSKDHKTPWSNILESVFGGNQTGQTTNSGSNQEQSQQMQTQSNQGLDPWLAQLLQKGNEILKRARGNHG